MFLGSDIDGPPSAGGVAGFAAEGNPGKSRNSFLDIFHSFGLLLWTFSPQEEVDKAQAFNPQDLGTEMGEMRFCKDFEDNESHISADVAEANSKGFSIDSPFQQLHELLPRCCMQDLVEAGRSPQFVDLCGTVSCWGVSRLASPVLGQIRVCLDTDQRSGSVGRAEGPWSLQGDFSRFSHVFTQFDFAFLSQVAKPSFS